MTKVPDKVSKRINSGVFAAVITTLLFLGVTVPAQKRRTLVASGPLVVKPINTEELKGLLKREDQRPLLVNFWATWCDPCREEFPELVSIDSDYRPKGLEFIAVSLDDLQDLKTEVTKFLNEMHARMPAYLLDVQDPEPAIHAVDRDWSGALPATFLYDGQGKVAYKHFGRVNPEELRMAIEKQVGAMQ